MPPNSLPLPALVVHHDWGLHANKRWSATACLQNNRYTAHAAHPVGPLEILLPSIQSQLTAGHAALLGFDCPIGLPAAYAEAVGIRNFEAFLRETSPDSPFYSVCRHRHEISLARPFYPSNAGNRRQAHLLEALGVSHLDHLRRTCELAQPGRRAANPLFWTLGANQVGKGALLAWRDLLAPALLNQTSLRLWPFHGPLSSLLEPGSPAKLDDPAPIILAETYPTHYHPWLFGHPFRSKTNLAARIFVAPALLAWAATHNVTLTPELEASIHAGFPQGDDAFDAVLGLFGMLEIALGLRPPGDPTDPTLRNIEGWILGQS